MGNAIWLLLVLPEWYFSSVTMPLVAGPLSAIPAFGTICLVVGLVSGLIKRERRLALVIVPFAASELLVAIAGFWRGEVADGIGQSVLIVFMVLQVAFALYLIYRMEDARLAGIALALFSVTYALFAAFVSAMSFGDVWV